VTVVVRSVTVAVRSVTVVVTGHTPRMDTPTLEDPLDRGAVRLTVDGQPVEVADDGQTLLDALRGPVGNRSVKDGCSPQGQCGCCTVLVDGQPRVSCVTPLRRVAGRSITTLDGLPEGDGERWADAFCATGGSQCGFCTPGIIMRFAGLEGSVPDDLPIDHSLGDRALSDQAPPDRDRAARALHAHLCRCTGWQTVLDAWEVGVGIRTLDGISSGEPVDRDASARRATLEGRSPQKVGPEVALGRGGFATDTAPVEALVAVPGDGPVDDPGSWVVADTLAAARREAGKVQGRRTTADVVPPLEAPAGNWASVLRTAWVEPSPLETDAAWCMPGSEPVGPLANGGAFGAKVDSPLPAVARLLADAHGSTVLVAPSREDTVRFGPKRPPVAGGALVDGTGILRVVRTSGIVEAVAAVAPGLDVVEVDVVGPPTSPNVRAAGWAEAVVLLTGAGAMTPGQPVVSPAGAEAVATVDDDGIRVIVRCGDPLDEVVLRSYCIGAAHMAWSWITSEGLSVDGDGVVHDLTIRSFGIVRATETPPVVVEVLPDDGTPINGSDAVFAAVAAATWCHRGCPPDLPTG